MVRSFAAGLLIVAVVVLVGCRQNPTAAFVCTPDPAADLCRAAAATCGPISVSDRCAVDRRVECGTCGPRMVCTADHHCVCPDSDAAICKRESRECGTFKALDTCGQARQFDCGTCPQDRLCGGDGIPNRCSACAETDAALCVRRGAACGMLETTDGCGRARTLSCGACPAGEVCGAEARNQCAPQTCEDDGFCWVNPLPQGNALRAAFAVSDDDAWAGGEAGTLLHWDGAHWRKAPSGTRARINAIWGAAANDVWAFGDGATILHWDGTHWAPMAAPTDFDLTGVWALSAHEIRVTTSAPGSHYEASRGEVLEWNGSRWTVETTNEGNLQGIWGVSASDYWIVGRYSPSIGHWNGSAWSWQSFSASPYCSDLKGIVGRTGRDVWAWGYDCFLHFNGTQWSLARIDMGSLESIQAVLPTSETQALLATSKRLLHWDGNTTRERPGPSFAIGAFAVTSSSRVFAAGDVGGLASLEGERWTEYGARVDPHLTALYGVWGSGPGDVVMVGTTLSASEVHGRVLRWDGTSLLVQDDGTMEPLGSVAGRWRDDIWAGAYRWNGASWMHEEARFELLAPAGPGALVGCHQGLIETWNGGQWTELPAIRPMCGSALAATSSSDVWMFGQGQGAVHWDGSSWTDSTLGNSSSSAWGASAGDVWAAASSEVLWHWGGDRWVPTQRAPRPLAGVCGRASDDVWAVGSEIAHWDGAAWTHRSEGVSLTRCWAGPSGEVWAIGAHGEILQRSAR